MNTDTLPQSENKKTKLSTWKVAIIAGIAFGIIAIVGVVALIYFPDAYLNEFLKNQIVSEFAEANPEYSIAISDLHIYLLADNIELASVVINSRDSALSCSIDNPSLRGIGWWQLITKGIRASGALDGSVAEAQNIVVKSQKFFHEIRCRNLKISLRDSVIIADSLVVHPMANDSVYFTESAFRKKRYYIVSPKITIGGSTLLALLQGKMCQINNIKLPNISIDMLVHRTPSADADSSKGKDTTMLKAIRSKVQLDSINMENAHITYSEIDPADSLQNNGRSIHYTGFHASFKDSTISVKSVEILPLYQPDGYSFRCAGFYASLRDSNLEASDVEIRPFKEVNDFFDASKFRQTRLSVAVKKVNIHGLPFLEMMKNKKYQAQSIELQKPSVSIQVSVFKPNKKPLPKGIMPNEILRSIKQLIQIDSVRVFNGKILYEEYCVNHLKPAFIVFNNLNAQINGITTTKKGADTADIHLDSEFMNGGTLTLAVRLPLTSPKFDMQLSGSLTTMSLTKFNTFLEIAERARIKSGVVTSANVRAQVNNGIATGNVRIEYHDFSMSFLDEERKSDKGIFNIIKSFLANTFKFNSSNEKDSKGVLKLGKINYKRKPNDTFVQFSWFAVRRGIADLIGFPDN